MNWRMRRYLVRIGEDMVNVAFDAPVDIRCREPDRRTLNDEQYEWLKPAAMKAASSRYSRALTTAVDTAANAFMRDGKLLRRVEWVA